MVAPYIVQHPARWIGLAFCLATAVVYACTLHWTADWYSGHGFLVLLRQGAVQFSVWDPAKLTIAYAPGFELGPRSGPLILGFSRPYAPLVMTIIVPLWTLLTVFVVFTILVWRRAPRVPPGHCRHCGYNLTGNVSGRCPECGVRREDRQGGVDERAIR